MLLAILTCLCAAAAVELTCGLQPLHLHASSGTVELLQLAVPVFLLQHPAVVRRLHQAAALHVSTSVITVCR